MLLQFVQIVYWLALSTWFGGVLFIAICAPLVFSIVRENNPVLPTVLSVNLENQHAMLLSNSIMSGLFSRLIRVELACAAALLLALVSHWALLWKSDNQLSPLVARSALYVAAVVLVLYDWRVLWPRIDAARARYIEHADEPDVANAAKDDFDRLHRDSITVLTITLFLLLGIVLFSANISAARHLVAG
jgi:hypothetical protein